MAAEPREQPSTEDLLDNVRARLLNRAACAAAYRVNWGNDFAMKEIGEAWACEDAPRKLTVAELMAVSDERLRDLGFNSWDGALTLVPLWAFPLIADGETLISISGNTGTVGVEAEPGRRQIDLDQRFGCIAYGFTKPGAIPEADDVPAEQPA